MATTPEHLPHIPHFPVPDIKGAARWAAHHWIPVGLGLATGLGGTYLAFVHDRGPSAPPQDNAPASDKASDPAPDQPSLTLNPPFTETNPQPASTAEAQKPTPTPEVKKECFIDDEEACRTARLVKIGRGEYVALQMKPGIPLITRLDGEKTVTQEQSPLKGVRIAVVNRTTTEVEDFRGDINAEIKPLWVPTTKDSVVGVTQGGEIYIGFTKVDPAVGGIAMDKQKTEKAFPGILQKPIEELISEPIKPSISHIYQP